jgi:PiT family inorganic phosphate transporter
VDGLSGLLPFLILVAAQDVLTGIFGAPSIVATMVASRAMSPRRAILLSTLTQLIGPFLFGIAVASAVGSEVVESRGVTPLVLYAGLMSTIIWMIFSWWRKIPCSSTHALIGGLVGSVAVASGPWAIHQIGLFKILLALTLTAPLGFLCGFLITRVCYFLARQDSHHVNRRFNRGQLVASMFLGLAVGSNNAQNAMGITALGLVAVGVLPQFEVPIWVIVGSAVCLAIGNLVGGMRLIRSVGVDFFPIRPIHGFGAEVASVSVIVASSIVGGDVSTTHVTSMSIVGAGSAESFAQVQWRFVRRVFLTWILTIPLTAILAGLIYLGLIALKL